MNIENDPNVIYGGDPEEFGPIKGSCASFGELIIKDLKGGGDRTSFINGMTNKSETFNDILRNSVDAAKILYEIGVRQDDVIAIISENRHEYPAIAFGAFILNAIVAPINVTYTERELQHAFNLSKPKFVFASASQAKKAVNVCRPSGYVKNVILFDGKQIGAYILALDDLKKKHKDSKFDVESHVSREVDICDQVALIFCSSGTTGQPKGVNITQENIMACLQSYRGFVDNMENLGITSAIFMNIAPWFHVLGFVAMYLFACSQKAVNVFLPKFDEVAFYKAIEKYKVNFMFVVPPIMVMLAKSPMFDKYDLSSVTDISSGAAALSKQVEDQVRERFLKKYNKTVTVRQGYGLSESTFGVTSTVLMFKPGSIGQPVRGMYAKVIDENGNSLGPNQRGELCFKGKRIMKGYINDPEATQNTIDKDGWLHSGDIGYYDEDQQFFIVDRLKEIIKYKAFQVPPAEIEGLLLSNPKVKDCGVIGIPDEESGELPFAFVVKQPGVSLSEQDVIKFVADNASNAKWLRGGVKFIEAIPKNPSGKLLRREMREMYKSLRAKL